MDSKNRNPMKGKLCLWPKAHYYFLSFQDWLLRKETDNQSKIREIWAAIFTSVHWLKEFTNHFCVKSFLRVQHSTADGELIRRSIKMFAVRFQRRPDERSWWRAHFISTSAVRTWEKDQSRKLKPLHERSLRANLAL